MSALHATLKRTAQLGLLAGDLAAVRTRRAGPKRDAARRRLVDRLGLLHGLPQKIGQLLAFSEIEASDPVFTTLTENEPSLSAAEARAEIERQLGGPLEEFFATFEPVGISASIGQVHRATLHDGRTVAVKIQHPGIADTIDYDLRALGWLTAPVGDLRRGFDLKAYRTEIGESLRRELDYRTEAEAITRFAAHARTLATPIAVPEVIAALSSEHLLVTTWLYGEHLTAARTWPLAARAALSASLIELFFKGVFDWGLLHADPHPGNYRFLHCDGRPTVGLLDFGCMKNIPPGIQAGMRGLVVDALGFGSPVGASLLATQHEGSREQALSHNKNGKIASDLTPAHTRFAQMGFNGAVLEKLADKLPAVAAALTAPFTTAGTFDAAQWNLRERLSEILGDDRMAFRTAGPPEMIFILRTFQGLLHYLKILNAPVDWREASSVATGFQAGGPATHVPESLAPRPIGTPSATPEIPATPSVISRSPAMLSETLHISVVENGVTKVALTFGAGATDNLPDLVPQELRSRLAARSIDLGAIAATARGNNYPPGELFSLVDGEKIVRVWLG